MQSHPRQHRNIIILLLLPPMIIPVWRRGTRHYFHPRFHPREAQRPPRDLPTRPQARPMIAICKRVAALVSGGNWFRRRRPHHLLLHAQGHDAGISDETQTMSDEIWILSCQGKLTAFFSLFLFLFSRNTFFTLRLDTCIGSSPWARTIPYQRRTDRSNKPSSSSTPS